MTYPQLGGSICSASSVFYLAPSLYTSAARLLSRPALRLRRR